MGIGTAVGEFIKLVLWVLGFFMQRAGISMEAKKAFYKYVEEMGKIGLIPAGMKKDLDDIFTRLEQGDKDA